MIAAEVSGRPRIAALNPAAERAGLRSGQNLADARATVHRLQVRPADAAADAEALARLALWATRYTPTVEPFDQASGADGLFLDITGAEHLHGGEAALLADLAERLRRFRLPARLALASTPGTAWALSRYGKQGAVVPPGAEPEALQALPVAALRLPSETVATCRRLGLKRIGDLLGTPRAPLTKRFGPDLLRLLDRALGGLPKPLAPIIPPPTYGAVRPFSDPVFTRDATVAAATALMAELAGPLVLAARGNGFQSIERLGRVEGVSRFALERLAEADAYRSLGLDRRAALWAVRGLDDRLLEGKTDAATHPASLFSAFRGDDLFDEPAVALPPMPLSEQVAEDYIATGLSLKAHPITFFRPMLRGLGAISAAEHRSTNIPVNSRFTVAGLVLMRQRPGTAKGVAFLTLEDETGIANINIIVWRNLFEAERRVAMTARFLAVRGRLQREGLVIHVLAESLLDLTGELPRLRDGEDTIQAFRKASASDDQRPDSRLQKSRNFR